jgi:hypothetical protein
MLKKINEYLSTHGMTLMVIGFAVAAAGLLVYIYNVNNLHNLLISKAAFAGSITGFCIYLVGRVYVAIKRHRARTQERRSDIKDEDS